ncbi:hypothetical protein J6590_060928 [Homalodisca vitripennis]|nr:hypothetical protein J6590_060928 [Homalodisca vitripennis]
MKFNAGFFKEKQYPRKLNNGKGLVHGPVFSDRGGVYDPEKIKSRLKHFLVLKAIYSVEEYAMCRWNSL